MILEALRNLRATKKTASHLYCPMSRSPIRARPSYSTAGRPRLEAEATYIISVLRSYGQRLKVKNQPPIDAVTLIAHLFSLPNPFCIALVFSIRWITYPDTVPHPKAYEYRNICTQKNIYVKLEIINP